MIGSFCSIGGRCVIGGGIHPLDAVSTSPVFLKGRNFLGTHFAEIPYRPSETVEIGHDVWIGEGAYIRAGVKVGSGAVIGAHAVVTRDVMPYAIVAGNPARLIRSRFDEKTVGRLLELQWWDWSLEKLKEKSAYFDSVQRLLSVSAE